MIIRYLSLLFFFCFSCNGQSGIVEKELKNCVNQNLSGIFKESESLNGFGFYRLMEDFESILLEEKLLSKSDRKDYIQLFDKVLKSDETYKKLYKKINILISDNGDPLSSTEIIFNKCPYEAYQKAKATENSIIYKQGIVLNQIQAEGIDKIHLIKKLIQETDEKHFKKIVFRSPVLVLFMLNIDKKNNPDKWRKRPATRTR